jgi:hypothetical protein
VSPSRKQDRFQASESRGPAHSSDQLNSASRGLTRLRNSILALPNSRILLRTDLFDAAQDSLPPNWGPVVAAVRAAPGRPVLRVSGSTLYGEQVLKADIIEFDTGAELVIDIARIDAGFICIAARRLVLAPSGRNIIRRADIQASSGTAGAAGRDGTDGAADGVPGEDGHPGSTGGLGATLALPEVCLFVGSIEPPDGLGAELSLSFPGFIGGDGGPGGPGGCGGRGAKGRRAASRGHYPKLQPGLGGAGGNGGPGGRGGDAGRGGNSAGIFLLGPLATFGAFASARFLRDGAEPGRPGAGGVPGAPGAGGEPGDPEGLCPARPERRGLDGSWPNPVNFGLGRESIAGDIGSLSFWEFDGIDSLFVPAAEERP